HELPRRLPHLLRRGKAPGVDDPGHAGQQGPAQQQDEHGRAADHGPAGEAHRGEGSRFAPLIAVSYESACIFPRNWFSLSSVNILQYSELQVAPKASARANVARRLARGTNPEAGHSRMERPAKPRLVDVAARAGVSAATVSRAISRPDMVRASTLARV